MIDACGADGQRGYARLPLHHPSPIIRIRYDGFPDQMVVGRETTCLQQLRWSPMSNGDV